MNLILYCILHTQKNAERYAGIVNSWGLNKNVLFFSDHVGNKIIKMSQSSAYASNEEKQINGIKYLSGYEQYEWYCFCDDDTFINTSLLEKEILNWNTEYVYGEMINYYPQNKNLYYLSGGAGFVMHSKSINQLYSNIERHNTSFADVSFGLNYQKLNIKIQHNDLFHSQNPSFYNFNNKDISKNISFHYITQKEEMQRLNDICSKQ